MGLSFQADLSFSRNGQGNRSIEQWSCLLFTTMVHIVIAASAAKQLKSPVLHRTIADSAAQRLKSPVFTLPLPRCLVSMRSPRPGSQAGVAGTASGRKSSWKKQILTANFLIYCIITRQFEVLTVSKEVNLVFLILIYAVQVPKTVPMHCQRL